MPFLKGGQTGRFMEVHWCLAEDGDDSPGTKGEISLSTLPVILLEKDVCSKCIC